jgi:GNAT superfamily N-acetyltransferase
MQVIIEAQQTRPMAIEIIEFDNCHQKGVEELVLPIQQVEFAVRITREEQPDLMNIENTFQSGRGNFWVALYEGVVIGSVGVVDIGNDQVALKKMFVNRGFRGKEFGVSNALMQQVKQWCKENQIKQILLGTIEPMKAAHRFYEKHGFAEVGMPELPRTFPLVHVDTKFYKCDLDYGDTEAVSSDTEMTS